MDEASLARYMQLKSEYSFEELSKRPIFQLFSSKSEPYLFQSGSRHETLYFLENTKILELQSIGSGQKVGFDSNSKTWFFEF